MLELSTNISWDVGWLRQHPEVTPLKIDVFLILDRIKSSKKGLNATGIWKNV